MGEAAHRGVVWVARWPALGAVTVKLAPEVNGLDENGKVIAGKTTLRDWTRGGRVEVVSVIRPEDLHKFTDGHGYRSGGKGEKCALYAGTGMGRSRDMRR